MNCNIVNRTLYLKKHFFGKCFSNFLIYFENIVEMTDMISMFGADREGWEGL